MLELVAESLDLDMLMAEPEHALRHGEPRHLGALGAAAGTTPRAEAQAHGPAAQRERHAAQEAEPASSWSPDAACDFLLPAPGDSKRSMQRARSDYAGQRHKQQQDTNSSTYDATDARGDRISGDRISGDTTGSRAQRALANMMAASPLELDHDMMGMLATNWTLNAPSATPTANWGFEPSDAQAAALYDASDALLGAPTAAMTNMMELAGSQSAFPANGLASGMQTPQTQAQAQAPAPAPAPPAQAFGGFGVPFQDCASLPLDDFPLYNEASGGLYLSSFDGAGAGPASASQLAQDAAAFFPRTGLEAGEREAQGASQPLLRADAAFSSALAAAAKTPDELADMKAGLALPHTALKLEAETASEWNGSSSSFSTVSSSPTPAHVGAGAANGATPATATATATTPRKPKRIRRLCSRPGCGKRARSQDLCIAHGGGRRCVVAGCEKSSQGGNMCIKHGGGKRCRHPGCDKAAQTNALCKAHGGGPRCQFRGCTKSSQGGGFCRAHGGGKRCAAEGCHKGTQRGAFCALHGGSRFCEVAGCMRNDRGGGFCAHHGGGKRCEVAGCSRSCRRNGLCSTHLRLLGHEAGGMANSAASDAPGETTWSL